MKYSIFDPTGNITALIEGPGTPEDAARLMKEHPDVEQAGFVREALSSEDGMDAVLEMAGGEFCGNASMSAAAWLAMKRKGQIRSVMLKVSGTPDPVEVRLQQIEDGMFDAAVHMPHATGIKETELTFDSITDLVPMVSWEGLTHLIIGEGNAFFALLNNKDKAEQAVKCWCSSLSVKGLGLMFATGGGSERQMTPLVYVPGSDTMFWEHSCASGSSAVCMYLASKEKEDVQLALVQPGGTLRVKSSPQGMETWLSGSVKLIERN